MGRMKILFITDNFPPEVNAPATRTYDHCKEWVRSGADVTVITGAPNFPHGTVYPGYKNKIYQKETLHGIKVIRVWTYLSANEGVVRRIVDYISFAFSSFGIGLFKKADIIVATSPQFFTTFSGFALSKIKRVPWIFELRDLWPESIKTVGAMKSNFALRMLEKIELFLYRDAAQVVALTEAFKSNLKSRGIPEGKIKVITNGSNLELFTPIGKDKSLMRKLGLDGKFVIGYIGTHGMAHSLEFIVNALEKIQNGKIVFLFIGDGARKKDVVNITSQKRLANVIFLDPIPKEQVPSYMSLMDVALVPLLRSETFKTVIPSKIFEAAAMHKPILLGVDGQAREIVEKYGAGLYFEPENESDFVKNVKRIQEDRGLYLDLQKNCVRLSEDFDRKKLAQEMLKILEGVFRESSKF